MKYLLLIGLAVFAYWFFTRNPSQGRTAVPPPSVETEAMVRCAQCGVHLPRNEAVGDDGDFFCSDQHRRLGKSPRT